jgi:hypothetical protein
VHFESRVPTDWERRNLPVILLTDSIWDPKSDVLHNPGKMTREEKEMRSIKSMSIGTRNISSVQPAQCRLHEGEIENELGKISPVFNERLFCERLISSVNVATCYRTDIDDAEDKQMINGVLTNDRHSKVSAEELSRKWNIGISTAKNTLKVTTQIGVRTAIHPMTRQLRVDHMHLHRQ